MEEEELWKPIKDYEGLYEISNLGRIRSLDRYIKSRSSRGEMQFKKGTVLKQKFNRVTGYYVVTLWKNGEQKGYTVHRLIASHFLPKDDKREVVNHKDGNKLNNCVSNLEWVSYSENLSHSYSQLNRKVNKRSVHKQTVYYINKEGNLLCAESVEEASRQTHVSPTQIRRLMRSGKPSRGRYLFFNIKPSVEDIERVDND